MAEKKGPKKMGHEDLAEIIAKGRKLYEELSASNWMAALMSSRDLMNLILSSLAIPQPVMGAKSKDTLKELKAKLDAMESGEEDTEGVEPGTMQAGPWGSLISFLPTILQVIDLIISKLPK